MKKKPNELASVLQMLLTASQQSSRQLKRGLILAYTPGAANTKRPGHHRLVISRVGVFPSQREIDIVRSNLRLALVNMKRPFSDMAIEPWLKKQQYYYHVIEWQELQQASLLNTVSSE